MYPPGFSILRTANEDYRDPDSKVTIKAHKSSSQQLDFITMNSFGKIQQNSLLIGSLLKKFRRDLLSAICHSAKDRETVNINQFTKRFLASHYFLNSQPQASERGKEIRILFCKIKSPQISNFSYRFGLINVKYGIAKIIKKFKIIPDVSIRYPLKMNPLCQQLEPTGGFLLKFKKICDS